MTPTEMFGIEPENSFWLVCKDRLYKLAFVFKLPPRTVAPCCVPVLDGDRWRVEVCAQHAAQL
jgi:hypothetical protein